MKTNNEMTSSLVMMMICVLTSFGTIAQVTCSRERIGEARLIRSAEDYQRVQDSVQVLAYDLYLISEAFPDYKYVHHTNDAGIITAVSVIGVSDAEMANKAATTLMLLEVLGEQVRTVDPSFLPKRPGSGVEGRLSQQEAATYKPTPPRMKDNKKNVFLASGT